MLELMLVFYKGRMLAKDFSQTDVMAKEIYPTVW